MVAISPDTRKQAINGVHDAGTCEISQLQWAASSACWLGQLVASLYVINQPGSKTILSSAHWGKFVHVCIHVSRPPVQHIVAKTLKHTLVPCNRSDQKSEFWEKAGLSRPFESVQRRGRSVASCYMRTDSHNLHAWGILMHTIPGSSGPMYPVRDSALCNCCTSSDCRSDV